MSDPLIKNKLLTLMKKPKFLKCVNYYRETVDNPSTLNRKLLGLILEFEQTYEKIKHFLVKKDEFGSTKKSENKSLTSRQTMPITNG